MDKLVTPEESIVNFILNNKSWSLNENLTYQIPNDQYNLSWQDTMARASQYRLNIHIWYIGEAYTYICFSNWGEEYL